MSVRFEKERANVDNMVKKFPSKGDKMPLTRRHSSDKLRGNVIVVAVVLEGRDLNRSKCLL